jgi:hypothetical protein
MPTAIAFTLVLVIALGLFFYQLWGRFNLLRAARGPIKVDRIGERVWAVLTIGFGQKKFIRPEVATVKETFSGWLHFFVFWGFTVLGLQITTMFGRAYSDHFYVPLFSPGLLGGPYMLVRDLFEAIVFVSIVILIARWMMQRPLRLIGFLPARRGSGATTTGRRT